MATKPQSCGYCGVENLGTNFTLAKFICDSCRIALGEPKRTAAATAEAYRLERRIRDSEIEEQKATLAARLGRTPSEAEWRVERDRLWGSRREGPSTHS